MPTAPGLLNYYHKLKETPSSDVSQRIMWNVRDSHATLVISPNKEITKGTTLTETFAMEILRPVLVFDPQSDVKIICDWLNTLGEELTLNIGGPRQSEWLDAYDSTMRILSQLFAMINFKQQ